MSHSALEPASETASSMPPVAEALAPSQAAPLLSNRTFIGEILSAQRRGQTCLPANLGLDAQAFASLCDALFCGDQDQDDHELLRWQGGAEQIAQHRQNAQLRQDLLDARGDEAAEVRDLLSRYLASGEPSMGWMVSIVTAGCMGTDHLWRDLGLASRGVLNQLLRHNFPKLVAENSADMKWKKFIYRKLCESGGDFVCRAPSCEACVSYDDCFGSEER